MEFYSYSNGKYCSDTSTLFDIYVDLDKKTMSFENEGFCDYPNVIDPLYYKNGIKTENKWHIKYFHEKLFILSNSRYKSDNEIEIIFEKRK